MLKNRTHSKKTAWLIVAALVLANACAFAVARHYVLVAGQDRVELRSEQKTILHTGWQVLHWSYSLLEYFKPQPET